MRATDTERVHAFDAARGILIVLVVVAHFQRDIVHDIIFLFHMPLFFMLSGCLLNREKLCTFEGLKGKVMTLLIPYVVYLCFDVLVMRGSLSIQSMIAVLWGGRYLSGTYWYATCYVITLILFAFLLKHLTDKQVVLVVLGCGGLAVIESHLTKYIEVLVSPGVPWNADVALMAVVYLAIGFYGKEPIRRLFAASAGKYDIAAVAAAGVLAMFFCFNAKKQGGYYFDMKPLYYRELVLAVIIPCAFGLVLARIVSWLERCPVLRWLSGILGWLGKMTIPIMFVHVPLNLWLTELFHYGRVVYVIVGIVVPVLLTVIFGRFPLMRRLLGLPEWKRKSFRRAI